MIQLGRMNRLTIRRRVSVGAFLGDEDEEEVLLPRKFLQEDQGEGQELDVFVYTDSEDRPVATTQTPFAMRQEFALMEVKDVNAHGAFLDWGLDKDLFCPFKEQRQKMEVGRTYLVYVYLDLLTGRMAASSKLNQFLEQEEIELEEGQEVEVLIWKRTDLGSDVIINNTYKGLLYNNEIFQPIKSGDRLAGFIKLIREDGKIDVSLQQQGYHQVEPKAQEILDYLKAEGGYAPFHDKSDPEDIKEVFHMSKKVFKKALGALYKQKLIVLEDGGVRLT